MMRIGDRYIVLKLKDLTPDQQREAERLVDAMYATRRKRGAGPLKCLVLESDWPEFIPACAVLEARIEREQEGGGQCWEEPLHDDSRGEDRPLPHFPLAKLTRLAPTTQNVPDGTYRGKWTAYHITVEYAAHAFLHIQCSVGVRGVDVPCEVRVKDGEPVELFT